MNLFNIGGEGQLYAGAIVGAAAALLLHGAPGPVAIFAMIVAGAAGGAAFALFPGLLRAFLSTNEIIVSLMLNYVAALVLNYLIFDSPVVLARHVDAGGAGVPAGQDAARRGELADRTSA